MSRWLKFHCGIGLLVLYVLASLAIHPLFRRGLGWETETVTFLGLMTLAGIGLYLLFSWFIEKSGKG